MEKIEFSRWLFEGRLRQGKNMLPDGLNWLCYFAGNSKSHRENSISFIFLESPHQVDMKNVVKCQKHFIGYFNALKTHGVWLLLVAFSSTLVSTGECCLCSAIVVFHPTQGYRNRYNLTTKWQLYLFQNKQKSPILAHQKDFLSIY